MPLILTGTSASTTLDSSAGLTFSDSSNQSAAASPFVLKNRIINGAMQVWQRGTSVTTNGGYTADRWGEVSGNSNQHIQSTDAPTNFGYSMQIIGVGGNMNQRIESLNCQDLSGQTITISFWVKNTSGTDSLVLQLYYANTADTFSSLTQIGSTVTISSNPSSTWTQYTTTFTSLPAGSKNGLSLYLARTGTGAVSTTWYFTGVQLEVGSSATPFERRLYGQELINCQRYYEVISFGAYRGITCQARGASDTNGWCGFKVTKRASPTMSTSGTFGAWTSTSGTNSATVSFSGTTVDGSGLDVATSGMSAGNASLLVANTSASIISSIEL